MITMRSNSVTKMTKPPPPVPPRPSKTIVAEALAKRRRAPEEMNTIPVRSAPPPPVDLSRSQSTVNFGFKRPTVYERSISEELKCNSRTLIFQSSNMKSANNNVLVKNYASGKKVMVNNSYVNCSEKMSNNKTLSETKNNVIVTKNLVNSSEVRQENSIKITQTKETITPPDIPQPQSNEVTVNSQIITCNISNGKSLENQFKPLRSVENISVSPSGTLQNSIDVDKHDLDEKWDGMLKDKNHVNKLIDEMFASVLESSNVEETSKSSSKTSTAKVSTDSTTITINGCDNNKYESPCNVETSGSTVLIIESADNAKIETQSSNVNSLTKTKGSAEKIDQVAKSNSSTMEKKSVKFDDKKNAEFLIEELESMRMEQEKIMKRQRKPSLDIYDSVKSEECDYEDNMGNYYINIVNTGKGVTLDYDRLKTMSSLHGLPPLPKSLSGFNLEESYSNPSTPVRPSSARSQLSSTNPFVTGQSGGYLQQQQQELHGASDSSSLGQGRKSMNLDAQLAILKREMYSLRQLDLSLLSQLWSLNESIQDFRQILQDQEDCRVLSPPSPSPAPSSGDEGDCDEQYYVNASSATPPIKFRPAPPPPPLRRSSNSSNTSTGV